MKRWIREYLQDSGLLGAAVTALMAIALLLDPTCVRASSFADVEVPASGTPEVKIKEDAEGGGQIVVADDGGTTVAVINGDGSIEGTTIDTGHGALEVRAADLAGTSNQVILSASGTGVLFGGTNVTLSLPQSIATSSNVQFGSVGVGKSPTQLLDIAAVAQFLNVSTYGAIRAQASQGISIQSDEGTGRIYFANAGDINLVPESGDVNVTGAVGVNDDDPDATVEAVGTLMVSSTSSGDGDRFEVDTGGNATAGGGLYEQGNWRAQSWGTQTLTPSANFTITTASGNRVRVDASGTGWDCTNITDGQFDGQLMTITAVGGSSDDFDLIDVSGQVQLVTSPVNMVADDVLTLQWDATSSVWREIGYRDHPVP